MACSCWTGRSQHSLQAQIRTSQLQNESKELLTVTFYHLTARLNATVVIIFYKQVALQTGRLWV